MAKLFPMTNDPQILATLATKHAECNVTAADILAARRHEEFHQILGSAIERASTQLDLGLIDHQIDNLVVWTRKAISGFDAAYKFLLSGWGKNNPDVCGSYCGEETCPGKVAKILRKHDIELPPGIHVADLEGVYWG